MNGRQMNLDNTIAGGEELVAQQHFASEDIRNRINEVRQEWISVTKLAEKRRTKLKEAEDLYQVCLEVLCVKNSCCIIFTIL